MLNKKQERLTKEYRDALLEHNQLCTKLDLCKNEDTKKVLVKRLQDKKLQIEKLKSEAKCYQLSLKDRK